jgi:glycosyltransferase involved in cell wall biosynthesis
MHKIALSVLMISKNNEDIIEDALKSVYKIASEIILIDSSSKDKTINIAKKYKSKIYQYDENDFGKKRAYALKKANGGWILFLDTDERLSDKLQIEIKKTIKNNKFNGHYIKLINYFYNKPLKRGGGIYKKLLLIKKNDAIINPSLIHEEIKSKSQKIGTLKNYINHYSYRNIFQLYSKFTNYAIRCAKQKRQNNEKTSFKKIFLYPMHMFWARYIKDKAYKEGIFRIPVDIGFAYMEFLTYFLMLFIKNKSK